MDIYAGGSVQNNGGHATDAHRNVPEHSVPWSREPPRELRQPPANGMFCSSRLEAHAGAGGPATSTPRKHAAPYSAGGLPFAGTSVHQHGNEAALAAQAKQLLNHWEPWQGRAYREEGHFEPQRAGTARSTASLGGKNETIARLSAEVQALQAARGTRSSGGGRSRGSSRAGARPRSSSSSNNGNNARPRSSSSSSWQQPPDLASEAAAAGLALYRAAPPSRGATGAYPQGGGGALGAGPTGYLATEAAALERQRAFMAGMPSVNLSGDGPGAPPPVHGSGVPIGRARPDTRGPFGRPANDGRSAVALREELREASVFPGSWLFRDAEDPARRVGEGHASMRLATPASPRGTRALAGGGSMKMFFSEGSSIRTELQPELPQGQRLLRKANLAVGGGGGGGGNGNARPSSRAGQPPPRRGSLSFGRETMAPGGQPAASYRAPTPSQRRQSSRQREEIASVRDLF